MTKMYDTFHTFPDIYNNIYYMPSVHTKQGQAHSKNICVIHRRMYHIKNETRGEHNMSEDLPWSSSFE
jgi:hypothetical protein